MSEKQPHFQIQKIYVKDVSFEAPNSPDVFQKDWKPEMNIEVNTQSKPFGSEEIHHVVLTLTCTVKSNDKVAFIAEVQQAGIFEIKDMPADHLRPTLGAFCPNILYPYLREVISDLVAKGGFPQLCLAPINFDALYQQQEEQEKAEAEKAEKSSN